MHSQGPMGPKKRNSYLIFANLMFTIRKRDRTPNTEDYYCGCLHAGQAWHMCTKAYTSRPFNPCRKICWGMQARNLFEVDSAATQSATRQLSPLTFVFYFCTLFAPFLAVCDLISSGPCLCFGAPCRRWSLPMSSVGAGFCYMFLCVVLPHFLSIQLTLPGF